MQYLKVRFNQDLLTAVVYKKYDKYGVAITKLSYLKVYKITDIKTGLSCGKTFSKLKDAKSFMNNTESATFKNWYSAVEKARNSDRYQSMIIKENL